MEAIKELTQLSESWMQATALLANEAASSPRLASTFLNVVGLGIWAWAICVNIVTGRRTVKWQGVYEPHPMEAMATAAQSSAQELVWGDAEKAWFSTQGLGSSVWDNIDGGNLTGSTTTETDFFNASATAARQ